MSADRIVSERERVTCSCCRRRVPPERVTGTRCTDRDACLRALGRWVSAGRLTGAEKEARRLFRGWRANAS